MALQAEVLRQIDAVLGKYRELRSGSKYDDCSDLPGELTTSAMALICDTSQKIRTDEQPVRRIHRGTSQEGRPRQFVSPSSRGRYSSCSSRCVRGRYVRTVAELVHAEVFSDFVEMAEHLLSEGYKDAAAVIVGSTLEGHLRQLCAKNSIASDVGGKAKKADQLNADLVGNSVYSKLDQKSITAWLDLRNKAAHGKYAEYSKEQVGLLVQGVRDFMARIPA